MNKLTQEQVRELKIPSGWRYWGFSDNLHNFQKGTNSTGWFNVACNEEDLEDGNLIWMMKNGYTR